MSKRPSCKNKVSVASLDPPAYKLEGYQPIEANPRKEAELRLVAEDFFIGDDLNYNSLFCYRHRKLNC